VEHNVTNELIVQAMMEIQRLNAATNQVDEASIAVIVCYFAMWAFASVGVYVTIRFIYRFVKNGFKVKKEITLTKYVYVDSYMSMAFFAFILSVIAAAIGRAYATGAIRL
jgi:hypothetical protein